MPPPPRSPDARPPKVWSGSRSKASRGAVVEINSETDFVAKNEQFQNFVREVARLALASGGDIDALGAAPFPSGGTVAEALTDSIAKIGENQSLRRTAVVEVSQGAVVPYVHNSVAPGLGKIGVLVALESAAPADTLQALGKQLAMHIAAANPLALDADALSPALIERERGIAMEKAKESGKPANIVEKMVEGSIAKFRKDNALLSQLFVIDNKTPVADVVAAAGKDAGADIKLAGFRPLPDRRGHREKGKRFRRRGRLGCGGQGRAGLLSPSFQLQERNSKVGNRAGAP